MMKKLLILLPCLMIVTMAMAENLLVLKPLGSAQEQKFALAQVATVGFDATKMYLYDSEGTELGNTLLTDLDKIVFEEGELDGVEDLTAKVHVYPNPTMESIVVSGMQAGQTLRVFSLDGKILSATTTTSGNTEVYVGNLSNGAYLLQIGAEVVKFIKE